MFGKLKRWAQPKPKPQERPKPPEIQWIQPDKNPWHVPVLDVRGVTQYSLSRPLIPSVP
jgi:hypothetical protein